MLLVRSEDDYKINHILSLRSTSHILSALDIKHACGADWCVNQF
ncbi:TPA: hypothetical protein ACLF33_002547 [Listeria monocytogenes]